MNNLRQKIMDTKVINNMRRLPDISRDWFFKISKWPRYVFDKDDAWEFKPTMAQIEERPVSPLGRLIFWIIVVTMIFAVGWMCLGKIDVVVSGRGLVIPEGDVKIIQPLDAGVVSAIMCREGDFVKKDQVLMEIDPSITEPDLESKQKNLRYIELEKYRIGATMDQRAFNPKTKDQDKEAIKTQKYLHQSSVAALQTQLDAKNEELKASEVDLLNNEALLEIARNKEKRMKEVADIVSRSEYEKALTDVITYTKNVDQLIHKIDQLKQELSYINANFRMTNLKDYSDKHKTSTEIQAEIDKTSFRNKKQKIVSPCDGYVSNLYFHTIGGVVTAAQKLMVVVPLSAPLTIKTVVLNKDIGFIREGMPVLLKIDTFDFQKYGTLDGTVRNVSKHSTEDEKLGQVYEVFITPKEMSIKVEGKRVPVTSGMSLTTEIKVDKRRVIEFFIYPIIKYLDEGVKVR